MSVCYSFSYLQRKLLTSIIFQKLLLKTENLIKNTDFSVWHSANWHEMPEVVGIGTLGGRKRNHDTRCHRLFRRPTEFFLQIFISTSANFCLPGHCVMGCCLQHNQMMKQGICWTLSLGGKCSVTTCIGVNVPRSYLGTSLEKMCCSSSPQGTAELGERLPLRRGGEKKRLLPLLLPNKSCEFIFTLANYVAKTMQGHFSLAYNVPVWACLNIEKPKIFIILLDSYSIIVRYDYLCRSSLAAFHGHLTVSLLKIYLE